MSIEVKICGLTDTAAVKAVVEGGAAMCGFVFFPASPRNLTPKEAAELTKGVPEGVIRVGLTVNADDALLAEIALVAKVDMVQLHGAETLARTNEVRERFGLPVIKVLAVQGPDDLAAAEAYQGVADRLMFDAKPHEDASRPGGNARTFDWRVLKNQTFALPWLLAGGLTAENLAEAVKTSGAVAVDVSSGVEDAPGVKNVDKIRAFLAAAAAL